MCPVSDGDYEESYIWGNEQCYSICRYYGCTFRFVNVQTWQPMSEKWFISYKFLFWVQLSWCKSCSWGWYENWGHNHDGEHIWSWYVSHALPLAWKLWNPLSIYHYFQSWIGHGMSLSKNKVGCMVIIFIKHLKDDIAWDVFWTQREHDKGCITTHHKELHDGFSDIAGKSFTPLYVCNDLLIYSGHAVQEGKSQPAGSPFKKTPVAMEKY